MLNNERPCSLIKIHCSGHLSCFIVLQYVGGIIERLATCVKTITIQYNAALREVGHENNQTPCSRCNGHF